MQKPDGMIKKILKSYVFAICLAAIFALFIRSNVVEAFRIPIDFMAPALIPGDHIFVNKLAYKKMLWMKKSKPERGDVIIFNFPNDPKKDYIKRVIGISGDTVEIRNGEVFVNQKSIQTAPLKEKAGNVEYGVRWDGLSDEAKSMVEVKVPENNIFVLGDNRAKGQDSRMWGFLKTEFVKGRASIIWFSAGPEEQQGEWQIRWDRMFSRVY